MNNFSNILLIGNGINRAYKCNSWNEMLQNLSVKKYTKDEIEKLGCPEPMKAILVTEDNIDKQLKNNKESLFGEIKPNNYKLYEEILSLNIDDILTTNYSYEFEMTALGKESISEKEVKKLQAHTNEVDKCEPKYLLHTYNRLNYNGNEKRIWHIHGEARKPNSMILGHYYYAGLLSKLNEINEKRSYRYKMNSKYNKPTDIKSWFDGFIMGNLYILGFGMSYSETDIWWLLNRKRREEATHGKTVYFNIHDKSKDNSENETLCKMLEIIGVEVESIDVNDNDWVNAYQIAINKIKNDTKV